MPSFPGSVKSFTTKNSGDVIQSAHVNDLQDEVNAIEAGYINATAPLNSSRSTVATLQVTGVSTLGGAVSFGAGVASTVSFASSVTFSSGANFGAAATVNGGLGLTKAARFLVMSGFLDITLGCPGA